MKNHPLFRATWSAINLLLLLSLMLLLGGLVWEYSTREYLQGFADAVVPEGAPDGEKVEAILAWMDKGPARRTDTVPEQGSRDPMETLNQGELLKVCGTATNAFVNLATGGGLHARRLLLLNERRQSKHVVAEVQVGGRWVVVDPLYRIPMRDSQGQWLSKEQLRDPNLLRQAAARVPGYDPLFTYELTSYVRLSRIPLVGPFLRGILDRIGPGWEETVNWTLVVERRSLAFSWFALGLFLFSLLARWLAGRYAQRRLLSRTRLRDQLVRIYQMLIHGAS